jgi:carbamoyl-phosphate synthase large subunit
MRSPDQPRRVLLTCAGGAYGLGVSRSLKAAGHFVVASDADRYSFQRVEGDERVRVPRASSGETFLSAITDLVSDRHIDFVWPGHDSDILAFARERDRLGAATFLPELSEIEVCRDKWRSYQRFEAAGVRVPETMMISNRTELRTAFDRFGGQVWLRAIRGAGGRRAMGTDSTRKAEAWLDLHDGWGLFSAARRIKGNQGRPAP